MKQINEKQNAISAWLATLPVEIRDDAKAIEKRCRTDLDKIEQAGIKRAPLLLMSLSFARKRMEWMSGKKKTRSWARHHRDTGRKLSKRLKKLICDLREFWEKPTPQWKSIPDNPFWKISADSPTGITLFGMKFLDASLSKESGRRARSKPDIGTNLLGWILQVNPDFKYWAALSRVVAESFAAVGIDEKRLDKMD
ncbi:MAG: hypothetical protein ABSA96_15280, partial [Candidatus Acidiferrales bacterium]